MEDYETYLALYKAKSDKADEVLKILRGITLRPPYSMFKLGSCLGTRPDFDVLITCHWENEDLVRGGSGVFRVVATVEDFTLEGIIGLARDLIRAALYHELDEAFIVEGSQPFFPHTKDLLTNSPFILERGLPF